ncbi:MAG: hypothetical protein HF982_07305 [Desulfobacteraceae bacterium]|nr:hypothetical protein [Desulfobacteraceae bacterium]MBC2719379.1 hypothetical protein [Desulfobacteraceae bacterium]
MSIQPEGEDIRKAVKWVSDQRKFKPGKDLNKIIEEACIKFNLSPKEAEFLRRFVLEKCCS